MLTAYSQFPYLKELDLELTPLQRKFRMRFLVFCLVLVSSPVLSQFELGMGSPEMNHLVGTTIVEDEVVDDNEKTLEGNRIVKEDSPGIKRIQKRINIAMLILFALLVVGCFRFVLAGSLRN